ncbi:MAG: DAK2 domain-containing protein [Actinomycetia bacterium]|nr:DAK2 domain-containing protein [Actinomycetes bacterium]
MTVQVSPREVIAGASAVLRSRHEEVNKLNVFPVPDGDTGTNMSLTLESVAGEVLSLPSDVSLEEVTRAATHGSLMGARGNSGVILSQIIRGVCEGIMDSADAPPTERLAVSLEHARTVAYQAVRKPVEGTILTVLSDMAIAARGASEEQQSFDDALETVSAAAHASVQRTPELLSVLKESGVVDSGGFGLAIIYDAVANILLGKEEAATPVFMPAGLLSVDPVDDWDDEEYLYCTEFLLFGDDIDRERVHDHIATQGGSELVVGDFGQYKIHVHTDDPSAVLAFALSKGEVSDVHIHNMRRQQAERGKGPAAALPHRKIAVIAVSVGKGAGEILKSLGVAALVSGGQTMNPATQDFVEAAASVPADSYILLPNNHNIIMAARSAAELIAAPTVVVPTTSVLEAFSALLAFDEEGSLEEQQEEMTEAASEVTTAEVTTAVKDAKSPVGDICAGEIIGIVGSKDIRAKGTSIPEVAVALLETLPLDEADTVTLLAGAELDASDLEAVQTLLQERHPDLEYDTQDGGQPLYPLIMSVE